jgi:histidinol phosphatase-like enzyme
MLKSRKDVYVFVITNQAGVALQDIENDEDFDLLTEKRVNEVNEEIIQLLKKEGAFVDGILVCPYVDTKYAKKAMEKGRHVNPDYVKDNCSDLKPRIGLLEKAAAKISISLLNCRVYFIGDRFSDVQMGLNANGQGHLVTGWKTKQIGDENKVRELMKQLPKKVFIHDSFLDAARTILKDYTQKQ